MAEDLEGLVERVSAGEGAAIADALAIAEDSRAEALPVQRELLGRLEAGTPATHGALGLTGPPGAGKSTLASALIRAWREREIGVGMVAVDPSSRRSGGALLGDRARLRFGADERVFVRSMAAREQLGGLAPTTRAAVSVLRAAFDRTLIETVGVGQSEVDVETVAETGVLVLQPGSGDTLQFMKAGILEIPDVLVVHKWDLGPPAERTRTDLESMLALGVAGSGSGWTPRVIGVSAETGHGVADLVDLLESHRGWLQESGELAQRRSAHRDEWALELFERRYGSLGLERLGGRDAVRAAIAELEGSALDRFSDLASRAGLDA